MWETTEIYQETLKSICLGKKKRTYELSHLCVYRFQTTRNRQDKKKTRNSLKKLMRIRKFMHKYIMVFSIDPKKQAIKMTYLIIVQQCIEASTFSLAILYLWVLPLARVFAHTYLSSSHLQISLVYFGFVFFVETEI